MTPPNDAHVDGILDGAILRRLTIANRRGLHARAAAKFVKVAAAFDAEITVGNQSGTVSASSIMGLMTLAAGIGSEIEIVCRGREARAALEALSDLIANKFEES